MFLLEQNKENFFTGLWNAIVKYYSYYSGFIHSIFPTALGDLVEWVLNAIIAFAIIRIVAGVAFGTREGDI